MKKKQKAGRAGPKSKLHSKATSKSAKRTGGASAKPSKVLPKKASIHKKSKTAPKQAKSKAAPKARPAIKANETASMTATTPLTPRLPMRKIFGRDSTIQSAEVIQIRAANNTANNTAAPHTAAAQAEPQESFELQPKLMWETLPYTVPAALRFIVGAAKRECEKAAVSLFSFGKFIAALPQELCGLELAFLIMRLEHGHDEIARICGLDAASLAAHLQRASTVIENSFGAHCPDISRKFHAQVRASRKAAAAMIEPVLIAEVDPNWQILLAELILLTLKHETLQRDGRASSIADAIAH